MKSYEINIICDNFDCDSIETSNPGGLGDAEKEIKEYCLSKGWEIQNVSALCPDCIEKAFKEQE